MNDEKTPVKAAMEDSRLDLLKGTRVFGCLPDDALCKLLPCFQEQRAGPGEVLLRENEEADKIYVIESGKADVLKLSEDGRTEYAISQLGPGDTAGEMAIVDRSTRTATVKTVTPACLLVLSTRDLQELVDRDPDLMNIYFTIVRELGLKLRQANRLTVDALEQDLRQEKMRVAMGHFIGLVIVGLTTYSFLLRTTAQLVQRMPSGSFVSLSIAAMFILLFIGIVKTAGLPLKEFGFNLDQWRRSVKDGIIFTLPILGILLLAKWVLILTVPLFANEPLFNFTAAVKSTAPGNKAFSVATVAALYAVSVLIQEILCRGGLQSPMHKFFAGPNSSRNAILFSNLIFTVSHLHMSIMFALMAFLPGLFWGWLYSRTRSLLSPFISHSLIGFWALFVLGIQQIAKMT